MKKLYFTLLLLTGSLSIWAQAKANIANSSKWMDSILIPAIIAAIGYFLKLIYDLITERTKRRRALLEEKLKNFYWPILTRLEENDAVWRLIVNKRNELPDVEKKIGQHVEEHIILRNHREIMSIIKESRYHAKFDTEISEQLYLYFKHVAIYEGISELKENTFPFHLGAPYPEQLDDILRKRTIALQKKLDRKIIF